MRSIFTLLKYFYDLFYYFTYVSYKTLSLLITYFKNAVYGDLTKQDNTKTAESNRNAGRKGGERIKQKINNNK